MLLLRFVATQTQRSVHLLDMDDLGPQPILAFLQHLELDRHNSVATRNVRLTAIHAFFRYCAMDYPARLAHCQRVLAVPFKRTGSRLVEYLEHEEVEAVLGVVDRDTVDGRRDYALLATMFNTGARVGQIVALCVADLRLDTPAQVHLLGKGRKERVCPLWPQTADLLRALLIGRERKAATLEGFFDWFGTARSAALYFVCSDMWKPYLKVVAERAGQAVQVLDRFHIMSHFSQAIDEVRRGRGSQARRRGPGTGAQAQPLAPAQASGESHRRAGRTACGAGPPQPAHGSRLPAQEGLPAAVGLRVAVLGRTVPRPLVHPDDALAARTDEGCCPHGALAPRPDPELVPSPGAVLQWRCRRLQREGQSDHQTGVWGFAPPEHWKSLCIMHLADLPEPELTHRFC